ncbi:MAG: hypothetical protein DRQ24_08980 [Candidatus Latescibacterota bacterium]|nr:MAG: hypothetical protein DRQ24_08980 [Candidatus Latescibacterota bacterium]
MGEPLQPEYLETYRFYVTNIDYEELDTESCWPFYNQRATVEGHIKESKLGFNLDKLPSLNFHGNAFYVQLVCLAYNILNWFKRFLLPPEFHSKNIRWLTMNLLCLAALVVRKKLQWLIKYPVGCWLRSVDGTYLPTSIRREALLCGLTELEVIYNLSMNKQFGCGITRIDLAAHPQSAFGGA